LLATGEEEDEESSALGTLYRSSPGEEAEEQVLQYAAIHNGSVDVTDASNMLKMPSDDLEQAMLKLLAEGRVKVNQQEGTDK
jgi:hypothetical protein